MTTLTGRLLSGDVVRLEIRAGSMSSVDHRCRPGRRVMQCWSCEWGRQS